MKIHTPRLNTLRNDSNWDDKVVKSVKNIAEDIVDADEDIYIRNDGQGEGKSTATLLVMNEGDTFASDRHRLLQKKKETMDNFNVDSLHVVGLKTALEEDEADKLPQRIIHAKKQSPVEEMNQDYNDYGKEFVKQEYDNELTKAISNQWKIIEEQTHAIFCSVNMIPLVDSIQGDEKGYLFLDEGVERQADVNQKRCNYSTLLQPFYNKKGLEMNTFTDRAGELEEEEKKDLEMAWGFWEDFVDWVTTAEQTIYKFSDQDGAKRIINIEVTEYSNWHNITHAYKIFKNLTEKSPRHNYAKSRWEIEKIHHIEQGNTMVLKWMNDIERAMDFLLHFYESSGNNLIRVDSGGESLLQSRKLIADDLVPFTDTQVTILDAESSRWMEEWNSHMSLKREGNREPFDFPIHNIQPRANKNTLTRKHINENKKFVQEICDTINNLHHDSSKKVGAVGYKNLEEQLDCPFLYYGDSQGNNHLKDVDILFVLGSPRVDGESTVKWYHDLKDKFPDEELSTLVDLDNNSSQKGYTDSDLDMLYDGQVSRKVRDAVGRGRTAEICFQIGQVSPYLNYEKERSSRANMFGKLGVMTGFDTIPVSRKQTKYGNSNYNIQLDKLLVDYKVEGTLDDIHTWLTSRDVSVTKKRLKRKLNDFNFYKGSSGEWKFQW